MAQHEIDRNHPPITDGMIDGATGAVGVEFIGQRAVTVYEIPDSDRSEALILFDGGFVLCVSCDPGYAEDGATRTPDRWEVVLYDASGTEAATAMRALKPGHWL